jgi:5-methylcytosine-specific restriction endonuclease McrA
MKICWDNLEGIHLTKNGVFRRGENSFICREACARCGSSYLTVKSAPSEFCGSSCANKGQFFSEEHRKKLSIANMGRTTSLETRKKISTANMGRVCSIETRKKLSLTHKGKIFSEEHRNNLSLAQKGKTVSAETRKKISKNGAKFYGSSNHMYKGGVKKLGLTTYDGRKDSLGPYEEIRKQEGTEILEVKCAYCGRWFAPSCKAVGGRLEAINNLGKGEQRFYCSENCRLSCPTYRKVKYPKGFKHTTSREVDPYLRQMIFELDNWTCQKCGKSVEEIQLHCHHIRSYALNKVLANDVDNCITLCKDCHKEIHSRIGCRYVDLQCERGEA